MAARQAQTAIAASPGGGREGFEMAIDPTTVRSRRAVLAASVGGAAALLTQALGRPLSANAANGDAVTVGGSFSGTLPTAITNSAGDAIQAFNSSTIASGLFAHATAASGTTYGVFGRSNSTDGVGVAGVNYAATGATRGVMGQADSSSGVGVLALSSKYVAVLAQSGTGTGVRAQSSSSDGIFGSSSSGVGVRGSSVDNHGVDGVSGHNVGVFGSGSLNGVEGTSTTGTGVRGSSNTGIGIAAHSNQSTGLQAASEAATAITGSGALTGVFGVSSGLTGIYGMSGDPSTRPAPPSDVGVFGYAIDTTQARGVFGQTTIGRGVQGQATSGYGVRGLATSGTGLSGEASTGYALRTKGKVRLEQSAGKATIASGTSSVVVTPGIDLTASSSVIATLNGNAGGSVAVKRVSIDTVANTFTIVLTANSTASVSVAWLVIS